MHDSKSNLSFALLLLLGSSACSLRSSAPLDDAGDEAWVRQATPMFLGRNPKSYYELKALSRLADDVGRSRMVDALAASDDYLDYWTEVLIDVMRVERSNAYRQNADCYLDTHVPKAFYDELVHHLMFDDPRDGSDDWCHKTRWDLPSAPAALGELSPDGSSLGETDGIISTHRLTRDEAEAALAWQNSCPDFTMRDVIRAALWTDNLSVIWSAQLIPFGVTGDTPTSNDNVRQANLVDRFTRNYLNRDDTCLGCHNTTYSVTGNADASHDKSPTNTSGRWNRHFPAAGHFGASLDTRIDLEGSALSVINTSGYMLYGGHGERFSSIKGFFEVAQTTAWNEGESPKSAGLRPWGMADSCSSLDGGLVNIDGYEATFFPTEYSAIAMMQLQRRDGVFALIDMMQSSVWGLHNASNLNLLSTIAAPNDQESAGPLGEEWFQACTGACHPAEGGASYYAPNLENTFASLNPKTLEKILTNGTAKMPALSVLLDDGIVTPPAGGENYTPRQVARDIKYYVQSRGIGTDRGHDFLAQPSHAVTFLYAGATINRIFEELTGAPLELEHGQSRTEAQGRQLAMLTQQLISSDWSLKTVLKLIALSEWVGRNNPAQSALSDYVLPQVVYPWSMTELGNGTGSDDHNGVGDLVHQRSVPLRSHMLHSALGWPDGRAFGGGAGETWPSETLMSEMGRFSSVVDEARNQAAFDTLLAWDELVGACDKPALVLAGQVETDPSDGFAPTDLIGPNDWEDFIDEIVQDATAATRSFTTPNPTVAELFGAVRNRILASPRIPSTETAELQALIPSSGDWNRSVGYTFFGGAGSPKQFETALRTYCGALLTSPQVMLGGMNAAYSYSLTNQTWTSCEDGEPCGGTAWCNEWKGLLNYVGHSVPSTSCSLIQ